MEVLRRTCDIVQVTCFAILLLSRSGLAADCNQNGIDDGREIQTGASLDCNSNAVPDECDLRLLSFGFVEGGELDLEGYSDSLILADFDRDGDLDLAATGTSDYLSVIVNEGNGRFAPPIQYGWSGLTLVAADLDQDGFKDLAMISGGSLLFVFNQKDGKFAQAKEFNVPFGLSSLTASDLDADGAIDLAMTSRADEVLVLRINRAGGFEVLRFPAGSQPLSVMAADLDGDRDLDLAAANSGADTVSLFKNEGDGRFSQPLSIPAGASPSCLSVLDMEGDQALDLIALNARSSAITVLRNTGDGVFARGDNYPTEADTSQVLAADADSDGRLDLISVSRGLFSCPFPTGSFSVFTSSGTGKLLPPVSFSSTKGPKFVAAGDLNGDGKIDVAVIHHYSKTAAVLWNQPGQHSSDCNLNGIPDECELGGNDCNGNEILDSCELRRPQADDCNSNGVPDGCETDCNTNGVTDECDISRGTSKDLNSNQVPDECELLNDDCNRNEVPDDIDLLQGTSQDCNANKLPDECDVASPFRFSAIEDIVLPFVPQWATVADLDGDKDLDLVVTTVGGCSASANKRVLVFLNQGDATLGPSGSYRAGANPSFVASSDLDGDGDLDLAVVGKEASIRESGLVWMLRNRGQGAFDPGETIAVVPGPRSLVFGDLDRDGDSDFALASTSGILVDQNLGPAEFSLKERYAAGDSIEMILAADLDSDGDLDLAASSPLASSVLVLWNGGGGDFPKLERFPAGLFPFFLAAGDLDRDGDLDLSVGNTGGAQNIVSTFIHQENGAFAPGQALPIEGIFNLVPQPQPIVVSDLDEDGNLDVAATASNGTESTCSVFKNQGNGTLDDPSSIPLDATPLSAQAGDLNGDGHVDLVIASQAVLNGNRALLLRNDGTGRLRTQFDLAIGNNPLSILAADWDGDGNVDLATANKGSGDVSVLFNEGRAQFAASVDVEVGPGPRSLAAGDFDGDGDKDLAVALAFNVVLLRNEGRAFEKGATLPVGSNPVFLVASDLDADGDLDLATANSLEDPTFDDNVSILLNEGQGKFAAARNYAVGFEAFSMAEGDLDGDGDNDLAVVRFGRHVAMLLNHANGTFSASLSVPAGPEPTSVLALDLDHDGDLDLAVEQFTGDIAVLGNRGGGTFSDPVLASLPPRGEEGEFLVAADFDGDGSIDLAIRRWPEGLFTFRNQGNGLFAEPTNFRIRVDTHVGPFTAADLDGDGDFDLALTAVGRGVALVFNHTNEAPSDRDRNGIPDECEAFEQKPFRRGEVNQDSKVDISDAVVILRRIFLTGEPVACRDAADSNDDGQLDISDAVAILQYLFLGREPPKEPFTQCGLDPTRDLLECREFAGCAI